ncbi:hypothetical protein JCM8547_006687 [Rhodosporidiobolus lusitaniae]
MSAPPGQQHGRSRSSSRPGAAPPSHARSTSAHSQHHHGQGMEGAYVPPVHSEDADFDFCNAFWLTPQRSRANHGREESDEERDWGKEGYETVLGRVKQGGRVLEDLRAVLKERASATDDYAKRLTKLSKHQFGMGETGHMERAILTLKNELDASAKGHNELAALLRMQEGMLGEFVGKREAARKNQQLNVEKLWKQLLNQRQHVLQAKAKYEKDAMQVNGLHASAALLQGRELDKATLKLDKVQQTVAVNERDYRQYASVLKETTVNWNMVWKSFCDLVQDQEEERLEFLKARMWDYANGLSTLAMAEDESAERTRTALEQCEPKIDIRIFVQKFGTGNAIPDPIPFHDVSSKEPAPRQGYRTARFQRSSTRLPGVKHSPSAVNDIARAIGQHAPPPQSVPPARQPSQPDLRASQASPAGAARPPSRGAPSRSSNPNIAASLPPPIGTAPPPSETPPSGPPRQQQLQDPVPSPGRFAVSPSANLRGSAEHARDVSGSPSIRPGHITAGAFQNRQSAVSPVPSPGVAPAAPTSTAAPARYEPPAPVAAATVAAEQPKEEAKPAGAADDDEDDPLMKALKALQNTPLHEPTRPRTLSHVGAPPGAAQVGAHRSSVDLRGQAASPQHAAAQNPHHRSQSSFSLAQPPSQNAYASPRSRPTSPAPIAAMMQPPRAASPNPAAGYSQAFPGERSRPHSRAGSNVSAAPPAAVTAAAAAAGRPLSQVGGNLASPPSVGNFRSSSPSQQHIPESLRPASPQPPRASSPGPQQQQQRPPNGFGVGPGRPPSVIGYSPSPGQQYGAPSPAQPQQQQQQQRIQQGYNAAASPTSPAPFSAYAPPPPQQHFAPPPPSAQHAPPPQQHQQHQQHPSSYPSQHFQQPFHQSHAPPPVQQPPAPYQGQQQQPHYPPQQHVLGANGYAYPVQGAPVGYPTGAAGGAGGAPGLQRTASTHSAAHSGVSIQQTPMQAYQAQQQQQPSQQYQQTRPLSVASQRAPPSGQVPPPTGQYTESGEPIIFYVNALYDYTATSAEEFSFSMGDVMAVTETDPDGWWKGGPVGAKGPAKLFPSNFVELLS